MVNGQRGPASTSLLARAPIVVCSRGSQQKYCVALSEKSWCGSSICDEYMLFLLAKWLGIHRTRAVEDIDMDPPQTNRRPYYRSFIFATSLAVALYLLI